MQIVIDIPERMYLNAKADKLCGAILLVDAIKNGTPLPKGHGRLIDGDAFQEYCFNKNFERRLSEDGLFFINLFLDDAQTIIEADRSKEE